MTTTIRVGGPTSLRSRGHAKTLRRRAELMAHDRVVRSDLPVVVAELRSALGARLVAYLGSVSETRAVREWAEGERSPRQGAQERLRFAHQIVATIGHAEGPRVARAWLVGLNPQLDDRSPAHLIREANLEEIGPRVMAAAREFTGS
jgi:hypothetical protein